MKRLTTAVLISAALLGAPIVNAAPATAGASMTQQCTGYRVDRSTPPAVREKRMRGLIKCVFDRVGIPGQASMALYVADRESNFTPWAINHAIYSEHDCLGLFQHMRMYWRGRAINDLPLKQFPHRAHVSAFNERANAWVTAVMVKHGGWGPWSTA